MKIYCKFILYFEGRDEASFALSPSPVLSISSLALSLPSLYETSQDRPVSASLYDSLYNVLQCAFLYETSHERNFRSTFPDLFVKRDFSRTHKQTRHLHSWTARDLIYPGKLLRGQTNSRILRNLRFRHQNFNIFD